MAKHNATVGGYANDAGDVRYHASCSCGYVVVELESEELAHEIADTHWRPEFTDQRRHDNTWGDTPRAEMAEILYTSKGHEVEVRCSDKQVLAYLIGAQLAADQRGRPNNFIDSLIETFQRKGRWSAGQRPWAHLLGYEHHDRMEQEKQGPEKSQQTFPKLVALLTAARQNGLKYPKVTAEFDQGPMQLSLAGSRARYPGSVNVTDGGSYEEGTFYGRIHTDGRFEASSRCADWVLAALVEFNEDPVGSARLHGQRTGNCCFCRKGLETKESVSAGYGPVCADNWGLPWGDTSNYEITLEDMVEEVA